MDILQLPIDILVHVSGFIDLNALCKLARTCKIMNKVSKDENLWRNLYTFDFGYYILNEEISNNSSTWKEKYCTKRIARIEDVKGFNANPTVMPGLDALQRGTRASQYRVERFAVNFLQDPNISRVSRGIYLSLVDKRTAGLLDAYFETLDFSGQSVLESLVIMLKYIQFPSHFSVITRFMLCFAQRYFSCNTGTIFKNTDAVYVLAFGIIMLNTDIHNSAVKNKMTLAQYIHNSSGINNGENLPEKMLSDIYNKIKEKPLVFNKLTASYESSLWSWVSDWISKLRV